MSPTTLIVVLLVMSTGAYHLGRQRAVTAAGSRARLRAMHSRPVYHGALTAMWCAVPAMLLAGLWLALDDVLIGALVLASLPGELQGLPAPRLEAFLNDVRHLAAGNVAGGDVAPALQAAGRRYGEWQALSAWMSSLLALAVATACVALVRRRISVELPARHHVERAMLVFLLVSSLIVITTTVGIVLSVLFESWRFFQMVSPADFLFGLDWSPPLVAPAEPDGTFGAVALFAGTLLIACIAMLVAVPIGVMAAIYLSEYATPRFRAWARPLLELLAGIPTVVYGFFAVLVVAPSVRGLGASLGLDVAAQSALAVGLVMGIMIIPFVSSLSDDVIHAVPQSLRDAACALGSTRSEMTRQVIVPAALPGIVGGILLAVSRALGETMIVVMAAGVSANLTANPLQAVTTVTAQMVALVLGDQAFDSPRTLAAFALGLLLFLVTLSLNFVALHVVREYRARYD